MSFFLEGLEDPRGPNDVGPKVQSVIVRGHWTKPEAYIRINYVLFVFLKLNERFFIHFTLAVLRLALHLAFHYEAWQHFKA
jgi:hypothetical protein